MKRIMTSLLSTLLAGICALPCLVGCGSESGSLSTSATDRSTTSPNLSETKPSVDTAALLSSNPYAIAGYEQAQLLCKRYYDQSNHKIKRSLTESHDCEIWYTAAFLDALSEAYRLYPDDPTIKSVYLDCLNECLPGYRVTGATITPPSGVRYRNITYYNAGKGTSGDFYYDDNAWICIAYLTAYEFFKNEEYLTRAEEILEFLWTGYDDYQGGGIYWSKDFAGTAEKPSNKGACTNAPSSISYLWAYRLTGKSEYLERGKLLYNWVVDTLLDSDNLCYAGVGDPWKPAYDQGTLMYATVLLYEIEQDNTYLKRAKKCFNACCGHIFKAEGTMGNMTFTMNRNPIYKSWCIGWIVRGMCKYFTVDSKSNTGFMKRMEYVLDQTLKTKDRRGQYDPFFCSPGTDFWDKDSYDNEVIMPSGVTSVLLQTAYFDVFLRNSNDPL